MVAPSSDPSAEPTTSRALAPERGCRLHVVDLDGVAPAPVASTDGEIVGPLLVGMPVPASDGSTLVVAGRDDTGAATVWSGRPDHLVPTGMLPAAIVPTALVAHRDHWHVFGAHHGRPWHAVSPDLRGWDVDEAFTSDHPNLQVVGAAVVDDAIALLGSVVVEGRPMGWTLLEGPDHRDGRIHFRARSLGVPLTTAHALTAPADIGTSELVLAITSPTGEHTLVRTVPGTGRRSWTMSLLAADLQPAAVVTRAHDLWLVGADADGGIVVRRHGGGDLRLDASHGELCAAVVHDDRLVVFSRSTATSGAGADATFDGDLHASVTARTDACTSDDQSSPAYIDSISAA